MAVFGQPHGVEFGGNAPRSCRALASSYNDHLVNQTYVLPDPFRFTDGSTVHSKADWTCRAAQIRDQFQRYELGYKPPKPPIFSSRYDNNSLTITAGLVQGSNVSFSVNIAYPNETTTKAFPAVIVYDFPSIPIPSEVAVITLNVDNIAQQNGASSRGVGIFYDLYGSHGNTTAGALMAWAWAVSRIIDAAEITPSAQIDPRRIAVTGCSRNGKGAMVAGAFDERIALTIPQESGSGGDACWRTSRDLLVNGGISTQTASEIIGENVWFSKSFDYFGRDNYTVGLLPVDHHELAGLVAPRGLYSTGNIGFTWLGDWSSWECMTAARKIYKSLGFEHNQGFSQDGPHNHCSFPADQEPEIAAFFAKFLLNDASADTNVFRTSGNWTFDPKWTPWHVPNLSH